MHCERGRSGAMRGCNSCDPRGERRVDIAQRGIDVGRIRAMCVPRVIDLVTPIGMGQRDRRACSARSTRRPTLLSTSSIDRFMLLMIRCMALSSLATCLLF